MTINDLIFAVVVAVAITFTYIGILNVLCTFFPERSRKAGAK